MKKPLLTITISLLTFILAPISNAEYRYNSSSLRPTVINGKSSFLVYPSNYNSIRYCNITGHKFAFRPVFSHYNSKYGRNIFHYTRIVPSWYNAKVASIRRGRATRSRTSHKTSSRNHAVSHRSSRNRNVRGRF